MLVARFDTALNRRKARKAKRESGRYDPLVIRVVRAGDYDWYRSRIGDPAAGPARRSANGTR